VSSSTGFITSTVGRVGAAVAVAAALAVAAVTVPTVTGGSGGGTCDRTATTGTFAAQVSAATAGQTVCLASGSYGTWTGTSKSSPGVTITAQSGAAVTFSAINLTLSGTQNFTVDGTKQGGTVSIGGGSWIGSTTTARNITIKNAAFTVALIIDGPRDSNILLDNVTMNNICNNTSGTDTPARLHLSYGASFHSGVTLQNSTLNGCSTDGVQAGAGINILNNEFTNIREGSCSACHTDAIQLIGAPGSVVTGNWLHNNQDGITAFDGVDNVTITNNAIGPLQSDPDCIDMYSVQTGLIEHNSCSSGLGIFLDHKSADPASSSVTIRNNVTPDGISGADIGAATRTNNLFAGATSPNVNGSPTFAGGTSPTSYAGFRLATGSAGKNAATDGTDIGIP
jgi:hypothetical protein